MTFPPGTRVYFDSNLWIYLLSPPLEVEDVLSVVFQQVADGKLTPVTSVLSWSETLVKPLRDNKPEVKAWFDSIFTQTRGLELFEITREILFLVAEIRASSPGTKTPDAIHLATAKIAGCAVFLTHDAKLKRESLKTLMHPMALEGLV